MREICLADIPVVTGMHHGVSVGQGFIYLVFRTGLSRFSELLKIRNLNSQHLEKQAEDTLKINSLSRGFFHTFVSYVNSTY